MRISHKYRFGAASNTSGLMFDPPDRTSDPQQQQQQQQQNGNGNPPDDGFVSPFADLDRDLLDDAARAKIEAAEQQLRTMHGQVKSVSNLQSQLDLTRQALQQLQSSQQQQQQQQQPQQLTPEEQFREDMIATYMSQGGMTREQAERVAGMNTQLFDKFGNLIEQRLGSRFAPIANQVFDSNARDAFATAQAQDTLGALQNPEIAQAVWDQVQSMTQNGQMVTTPVVQNLAFIHYGRALAEGRIQPQQQQQQQTSIPINPLQQVLQQQQQPMHQQTRLTYPGAGNHVRTPTPPNPGPGLRPVDPDTDAALMATVKDWPVTPKAYKANGRAPSVITRGGV